VTSFREIWRRSPILLRLRRITLADLTDCAGCRLLDVCSPCLGLSLLENGNWAGPAPTKCRSAQVRARALVNLDGQ
jgi:MoaA/NifB/PqqE/SkfB family radical SAM enzyme